MNEEDFEDRRTPPAPIGHRFEAPIVEELPRQTPHAAGEGIDAAKKDKSENPATADSPGSRDDITDPSVP